MKTAVFILTFFLAGIQIKAQQLFFIAIDADQQQPFAVLMGKKSYSSNSQGHLVLSGLKDSLYEMSISFPKNSFPDQLFRVEMKRKDRGFQLKKITASSWGLYDWQTMDLLKPVSSQFVSSAELRDTRTDAFAVMMAAVVNDTAVLVRNVSKPIAKAIPDKKPLVKDTVVKVVTPEKTNVETNTKPSAVVIAPPVVSVPPASTEHKEEPKKDLIAENKKTDTVKDVVKAQMLVKDTASQLPMAIITPAEKTKDTVVTISDSIQKKPVQLKVVIEPDYPKPVIKKVFDNTGKESRAIIFRDSSSLGIDTIRIKIDIEPVSKEPETVAPSSEKPIIPVVVASEKKAELLVRTEEEVKNGKRPVDTIMVSKAQEMVQKDTAKTVVEVLKQDSVAAPKKLSMVNSDCVNKATDTDLDKLRVKMLAATTTEDRILIARKAFKAKCYYTRQIKALTELFFSDENRYQFFDAAYPFVVDTDEFKSLVKLLTEEYYINRFKVMVRF